MSKMLIQPTNLIQFLCFPCARICVCVCVFSSAVLLCFSLCVHHQDPDAGQFQTHRIPPVALL